MLPSAVMLPPWAVEDSAEAAEEEMDDGLKDLGSFREVLQSTWVNQNPGFFAVYGRIVLPTWYRDYYT